MPFRNLRAYELEILLDWQGYRCGYTGCDLLVPGEFDLRSGYSYSYWLETLSPVNYAKAAALVRVNRGGAWERGNLVFICAPWAKVHESYKDMAELVIEVNKVASRISAGQVPVLSEHGYYDYIARA